MAQNEFAEMLATFDRWIASQERIGWASPAIEKYARRVRNGLWACSRDRDPHEATIAILSEDTEALDEARNADPAAHAASGHRH